MKRRVTEADPNLPHQIKLRTASINRSMTKVTCNCWPDQRAMAVLPAGADVWPPYNDPSKHNPDAPLFVQGYEQWKVYDDVN